MKMNSLDKVIWKYELEAIDFQEIEIPRAFDILSVQAQDGKICLWSLIHNKNEPKEKAIVRIIGTGNPIYDEVIENKTYKRTVRAEDFKGTVQINNLVFHVFIKS